MGVSELLILVLIGLCAGIVSGMVGIGGGIIIVPALVFFMHLSQHKAQGVSIGMLMLPVGFMAAYNYYKAGNFDMRYSLLMGLGFIGGAFLGSKIALAIDPHTMKRIFGVFILIMALRIIFQK
ncbi:MAG: sulfite exporter TauE/SafE family protein [Bacteroidia bacterium]|nr:sulfite exporter TauE/SafE family protein [Bacteroidia bacterium]MCC6767441.1 sulfite exporter TauE/SafE family protein [Bacteroidia bacterium]